MRWLNRIRWAVARRRRDDELAEELAAHRALAQERFEREGLPPEAAAEAARRALGNATLAREDAREVWAWPALEAWGRDARHGVRLLIGQPTFALTAIITVALGMALTTTVFSVVDGEIWKPLPFPQPDRLVAIFTTGAGHERRASAADLAAWRAAARGFDEIAAFRYSGRGVLRAGGAPASVLFMPVTTNFFAALRMVPVQGRAFGPIDARSGAVVLSDAAWRTLFDADPGILGRRVLLDGRAYPVVGIAGRDQRIEFSDMPDLFVSFEPDPLTVPERDTRDLCAFGRLAPGATLSAAQAQLGWLAPLASHLPQPSCQRCQAPRDVRLEDLRSAYTGWNWRPLLFFLGASVFVLLLTCGNIGGLLVARALGRQREFAIRRALGAGERALFRQLLIEGALIAIAGAAVGLLMTAWGTRLLPASLPSDYLTRNTHVVLDARVFLFAFAACTGTALVFGVTPALLIGRRTLQPSLATGGRTLGGAVVQRRARSVLVVGEIALALVLLAGAGLFVNSFVRLLHVPLGFRPHHRLLARITLAGPRYDHDEARVRFIDDLLEKTRALPGIAGAAAASTVPLGSGPPIRFVRGDRPRPAAGHEPDAIARSVTPGYFAVLGIRRLAGRTFTAADRRGSTPVAIVNETLARTLFAGESPVGKTLVLLPTENSVVRMTPGPVQIIGVASNVKEVGFNEASFDGIYLPAAQASPSWLRLVVRSDLPASVLVGPLRRALLAVDPTLPLDSLETMDDLVAEALREDRFNASLIAVFAAFAVLLAALGLYGVMAWSVEQRRQEFGVRIALGARRAGILSLALRQCTRLGLAGVAIGLGLALVIARLLGTALYLVPREHDGLLYGVTLTDPLTLSLACAVLLFVALLAGLVPARRASIVDPLIALRAE
ncbi:MAG TPA: ABC transporter permease [Vicinamibacterales bacterium]|nr:ABC transporter permease [Vicinamibacterales bacterium]